MRYILYSTVMSLLLCLNTSGLAQEPRTIGVVVPIQIQAMEEIIAGFQQQLTQQYPGPIRILVKNAQGDINMQRAIIQGYQHSKVDVIATIGTTAALMAISMEPHQPIITISADLTHKPDNVTGVLDEINVTQQINFIHQVLPQLRKITLIHSSDDKIFQQVTQVKQACRSYGISVQTLMMQQLADLYGLSKHVADDSQAIFILKDLKVVSGIATLAQLANQRHIPLISSDDGSVRTGAVFALGTSEKQAGIDAANLTAKVLADPAALKLPLYVMQDYVVFTNAAAAQQQHLALDVIGNAAQHAHYPVQALQ